MSDKLLVELVRWTTSHVRKGKMFQRAQSKKSCAKLFVAIAIALILSACARPPSTTVGEGADPFQVDKDVVFRTTYYFRVFDYCELKQLKNANGIKKIIVPLTDSLYRFRMTGKSKSIFSDVKFESGTLKAWEIDPFGVKVEFDKESKRYRVIPPHEVESDAQRAATLKNLNKVQSALFALRKDFLNGFQNQTIEDNDPAKRILEEIDNAIINGFKALDHDKQENSEHKIQLLNLAVKAVIPQIIEIREDSSDQSAHVSTSKNNQTKDASESVHQEILDFFDATFDKNELANINIDEPGYLKKIVAEIIENYKNTLRQKSGNGYPSDLQIQLSPDSTDNLENYEKLISFSELGLFSPSPILCPENTPVRRGFQVLGPEGWRTFDQDERLILAMSSSTQPLVSTLKELASRSFKAQTQSDARLLSITTELKVVANAIHKLNLEKNQSTYDPKSLANAICNLLVEEERSSELCKNAESN